MAGIDSAGMIRPEDLKGAVGLAVAAVRRAREGATFRAHRRRAIRNMMGAVLDWERALLMIDFGCLAHFTSLRQKPLARPVLGSRAHILLARILPSYTPPH